MKILLFLAIIFLGQCNPYPIPKPVLEEIFPGEGFQNGAYPRILLEKKIQLNESPDLETLFLVQRQKEEILICLEKDKLSWYLPFSLQEYGLFKYDMTLRKWKFQNSDGKSPVILNNLSFFKLPGDNFYSIFSDVFSEEPPLNQFLVPIVIRVGRIAFNGMERISEEKFLIDWKKSNFQYDEKKGELQVVAPNGNGVKLKWTGERFEN
ncbi:MAG: hypothetical protein KDK54_12315 [Leptospiraceae bacterium]|nr:hypothetical protein [Leptospiraceae bacterium]